MDLSDFDSRMAGFELEFEASRSLSSRTSIAQRGAAKRWRAVILRQKDDASRLNQQEEAK